MDDLDKMMAKLKDNKGGEVKEEEKEEKVEEKPKEEEKVEEKPKEEEKVKEKPKEEEKVEEKQEEIPEEDEKVGNIETEISYLQNNGIFRRELLATLHELVEVEKTQAKILYEINKNKK